MTPLEFITAIAPLVQKYAVQYGIKVCSPVIAQACLESGYGTSTKAQHHNYFGLKYKPGRIQCNNGYFYDGGSEQNPDGTYVPLSNTTPWFNFNSMDEGVEGYFQFINTSNYSNLKGITDPVKYLKTIKSDGYATSLNYVNNVKSVIVNWDLTKYDKEMEVNNMAGDSSLAVWMPTIAGKKYAVGNWKKNKITIHHMAGRMTASQCANMHKNSKYSQSANYYVGYDGSCVQSVLEKDRSYCSSYGLNDQSAVTIEVSNDSGAPLWTISDAAMKMLISLCVDICKRNGIPQLTYTQYNNAQMYTKTSKGWALNQTFMKQQANRVNAITLHKYYSLTACPGPTLESNMPIIAAQINQQLKGAAPATNYIYNGLDYGKVFDPEFYSNFYADLKAAFGNDSQKLFNHFIQYGIKELRIAKIDFNIHAYAYYNIDLVAAFGQLSADTVDKYYNHYLTTGYKEGRRTC